MFLQFAVGFYGPDLAYIDDPRRVARRYLSGLTLFWSDPSHRPARSNNQKHNPMEHAGPASVTSRCRQVRRRDQHPLLLHGPGRVSGRGRAPVSAFQQRSRTSSGFHALHVLVARAHRQDPPRAGLASCWGFLSGWRTRRPCCELPELGAQAPKDRPRGTLAFLSRLAFRVSSTPKSEAHKGRRFAGHSVLGGSPLAGLPVTDRLGAVWPGDGGESLKPAGPGLGLEDRDRGPHTAC